MAVKITVGSKTVCYEHLAVKRNDKKDGSSGRGTDGKRGERTEREPDTPAPSYSPLSKQHLLPARTGKNLISELSEFNHFSREPS